MVTGGVEAECEQALKNLSAVLQAGGASLDSVLKVTMTHAPQMRRLCT